MNHQQQQPATISIKLTLVATNENRFLALPSPSFALLIEKIATLFDKVNRATIRIHYVDDESDRVAVSSSDELACAISLFPAGRPLRLFVSTAETSTAAPQQVPTQEPSNVVPTNAPATGTTPTDVFDQPKALNDNIDLTSADIVKKQPLRPDSSQLESLHELRQARRAERLAARLARQEQKKQLHASNDDTGTKKRVDAESVETLVALMADLGLVVAKGRCTGALRRADGDVDAAKAELVNWLAKRQERQRIQAARAPAEDQETNDTDKERLLAQLDQMGFGAPTGSTNKEAERIRKRNERLVKRFDGDLDPVASLLKARSAKIEERTAARKARQAERPRGRRNKEQAKASTAC